MKRSLLLRAFVHSTSEAQEPGTRTVAAAGGRAVPARVVVG